MPAPKSSRRRQPRRSAPVRRAAQSGRLEQLNLEMEPEGTLDQRIQWAKATAGNYEEMAAKETNPELRARQERRAARWNKQVLDLIELRRQQQAQMELF